MSSISRKNMNIVKQEQKAYNDLMKDVEKKIDREYAKAHADLARKTEDYFRRFEKKDAIWKGWVQSGEKSEEQYRSWRAGQMAMGQRWENMRDVIATDLAHSDQIAAGIVNDSLPDAYALGHNWGTYQVETNLGINTGYTLYNHSAVERLMKDDPDLLPKSKVKIPEDKRWNRQHLDSAITQGILQGESIPDIAKRLEAVTNMNHKAALRNARTMTGSAQNAGHFDAYKRAENMGIDLEKQWVATFDNRTRTSHRYLHGETQPMDEPFSNGLMYPKDPNGAAEEVYNCRCRLISNVIGYRRDIKGIYNEEIMGMSYEEWLDATPVSQKITHGEEVAEAQKMRYINEYRRGAKNLKNKSSVVNGRDLSEEWRRREDQFDFEIEDVINAQGFDGKPRVVSREEFEKAVKENNIICMRGYTAKDEETLKAYQDALYNGDWYVDCSKGGAAFGRGMYSAGNIGTEISDQSRREAGGYGGSGRGVGRVETFTLDNPKIINHDAIMTERWRTQYDVYRNNSDTKLTSDQECILRLMCNCPDSQEDAMRGYKLLSNADDVKTVTELRTAVVNNPKAKSVIDRTLTMEDGEFSAMKGYDAIQVDINNKDKYFVVLNRTKCIFLGDEE